MELPAEARYLQRSLAARVSDALISATRRVLLASPYWSEPGNALLLPSLQRAITLNLPVTLAGARREDGDHHAAMMSLGRTLADAGCEVEILTFVPPKSTSLFHAKIVTGQVGYLGSANLTASGLGEHVEVGVPLQEPDVERVWWLVDVLRKSGLLTSEPETS